MSGSKIINDPVHGFIEIPKGIILDLIDTDVYQRLRRIRQLALSYLVYPGAVHSRFNHCIGAMHLTDQALTALRSKGVEVTDEEFEGTLLAILLHDIGHGPFSHALESVILQGLHHERMSMAIMRYLNKKMGGALDLAIKIFKGDYPKFFLHQLVSSQLDMDRMDYLVRDSYFTGVVEGLVSADRIIKTLDVRNNRLVVELKGIYSVENFLVSRRLMYWQVYLHRAVLSAEYMMVHILERARELMYAQKNIWTNDLLEFFFRQNALMHTDVNDETIQNFIRLDDEDILYAMKQWRFSDDKVLNVLCSNLLKRSLLKVKLQNEPFSREEVMQEREKVMKILKISETEASHFVFKGDVSNLAYMQGKEEPITILNKDGSTSDITEASDIRNIDALSRPVVKYFLCYPGPDFLKK
ncbi:MAG: HD domain-containing protein [Bacteroidia bacterium]|nr:HD domain-containing protein [Bacteroidia bacterium]